MNIKNLLVSAIIFASTITSFNTKTQPREPLVVITGAILTLAAGAVIGVAIDRQTPSIKEKNLEQMLAKKEAILREQNTSLEENKATIKDLRDKTSEIEDFTVIGKDGIVKMRKSFGDTLDSLNKNAQGNHIILTDKMGRNHILCHGERSALFQNTRDFHKCPEWMDAFNQSSKKTPTN